MPLHQPHQSKPIFGMLAVAVLMSFANVAHAKQAEVDPAVAISGAALAKDLLTGINSALTTKAQVDAATESAGPDNDDLGSRATSDSANTPFETDLEAWTTFHTGGATLGPNGSNPHSGVARMHVTSGLLDGNWTVTPGHRYAISSAKPDSTPVANSSNKTAVASVATFGHNSKVKKGFTIQATEGFDIALQSGEDDIVAISAAAVLWSASAFGLNEVNGIVTVTPPVDRVSLIHNFAQLEGSINYRKPFLRDFLPESLAEQKLNEILDDVESDLDTFLGTVPTDNSPTPDFTLTAIDLLLVPGDVVRAGRTDLEVIEEYLQSFAVWVEAPDSVQAGYEIPNWSIEFVGANQDFSPGTLLAQDGGFGSPEPIDGQSNVDFSQLVGVVVNTEGRLLDAVNLAAQTPGSYVHNLVQSLGPGENFELDLFVSQSSQSLRTSEAVNWIEVPDTVVVTRGTHVAGDDDSLAASDNIDFTLQRGITDFQARTEFVALGTSPTANPSSFAVTLEGAVLARSPIVQTIELFNYLEGVWEYADSSIASNVFDSTFTVQAEGNLSRFVNPETMSVEARIQFLSESPRQRFASRTDQLYWSIE